MAEQKKDQDVTPQEPSQEKVPTTGNPVVEGEQGTQEHMDRITEAHEPAHAEQGHKGGLLEITAADVGRGAAVAGRRNYGHLHSEERMQDVERGLAQARQSVAGGKVRLVRCLICHNQNNVNYDKQTIITHLYSVHGMNKEDYQAYCLNQGWIDRADEAPVRSPDLNKVFAEAGRKGASTLFQKIDQGQTHLFRGDAAEATPEERAEADQDYVASHSDNPRPMDVDVNPADLKQLP